jgi:hypothetical protein
MFRDKVYKAYVYISDNLGNLDGTRADDILDIQISSSQQYDESNLPYADVSTVSRDGFNVKVQPKLNVASNWFVAVYGESYSNSAQVTVAGIKAGTNAYLAIALVGHFSGGY